MSSSSFGHFEQDGKISEKPSNSNSDSSLMCSSCSFRRISIAKFNFLMMLEEIITVYSKNHMEHINSYTVSKKQT
jgi:hypothetical protein